MTTTFDRPTGAVRDMRELEYLSALLQTNQQHLRADGTIKAGDIVLYLRSRHGIVVEEDTVKNLIMKELAGQTMNVDSDVLDLCQLTAILLIPQLLESAKDESRHEAVFGRVHDEIASVIGNKGLTRQRLRETFAMYGDFAVSNDLLDEMIVAASPGSKAFIHALTRDLSHFNLEWQVSASTNFDDATGGLIKSWNSDRDTTHAMNYDAKEELEEWKITKPNTQTDLKRMRTFAFIDYSADDFRRPLFVMLLWTCFVATYFAYVVRTGVVRRNGTSSFFLSFPCKTHLG